MKGSYSTVGWGVGLGGQSRGFREACLPRLIQLTSARAVACQFESFEQRNERQFRTSLSLSLSHSLYISRSASRSLALSLSFALSFFPSLTHSLLFSSEPLLVNSEAEEQKVPPSGYDQTCSILRQFEGLITCTTGSVAHKP